MNERQDMEDKALLALSKLKHRVDTLQTKAICNDLTEKQLEAIYLAADMADNILFMELLEVDIDI